MTESEVLKRAKIYIDKLANGVNPLDDTLLPETDIVNNVRISRCLFYVAGVLRETIENGGAVPKRKTPKEEFHISFEEIQKFPFSNKPIPISEIAKRINTLTVNDNMKKITHKHLNGWLVSTEMLSEKRKDDGTIERKPTENGVKTGIFTEIRSGMKGEYTVVLYNHAAQQFIIDNIEAVMGFMRK